MKQLLGWSTNHDGTDSVSDRCATWMHHQNQGTGTTVKPKGFRKAECRLNKQHHDSKSPRKRYFETLFRNARKTLEKR
jgi:hypothetical protein